MRGRSRREPPKSTMTTFAAEQEAAKRSVWGSPRTTSPQANEAGRTSASLIPP
ncbi:MAG: hypothetical protein R2725_04725 [Solirubrobacterales bacterium]